MISTGKKQGVLAVQILPKPRHYLLRSVRHPKRTLSIILYQRQSSQAGRLLHILKSTG